MLAVAMAHRWAVQALITLPKARSALVTKEAVMGTTKAVLTGERQAMYGLYGSMEKAQTQFSMFVLTAVATLLTQHLKTKIKQEITP